MRTEPLRLRMSATVPGAFVCLTDSTDFPASLRVLIAEVTSAFEEIDRVGAEAHEWRLLNPTCGLAAWQAKNVELSNAAQPFMDRASQAHSLSIDDYITALKIEESTHVRLWSREARATLHDAGLQHLQLSRALWVWSENPLLLPSLQGNLRTIQLLAATTVA